MFKIRMKIFYKYLKLNRFNSHIYFKKEKEDVLKETSDLNQNQILESSFPSATPI